MKKLFAISTFFVLLLSFSGCSSDSTVEEVDSSGTESSASDTMTGESEMITITSPAAGETVSSPFEVSGTTTMTEETSLLLEVYGADGVLNHGPTTWHTDSDGSFNFIGGTYYFIGGGGTGRVEVSLIDEDGNEIDKAVVSVELE